MKLSKKDSFQHLAAIQHALLLLLIHCQRVSTAQHQPPSRAGNTLLNDFMQLVNSHYNNYHQVKDYAQIMGVTTGHLSDTVSMLTGQTALNIIHQRIVLEAKRILIHTNQSINRIAIALSFNDPSYFGRFFKRIVGDTPNQFRKQFR